MLVFSVIVSLLSFRLCTHMCNREAASSTATLLLLDLLQSARFLRSFTTSFQQQRVFVLLPRRRSFSNRRICQDPTRVFSGLHSDLHTFLRKIDKRGPSIHSPPPPLNAALGSDFDLRTWNVAIPGRPFGSVRGERTERAKRTFWESQPACQRIRSAAARLPAAVCFPANASKGVKLGAAERNASAQQRLQFQMYAELKGKRCDFSASRVFWSERLRSATVEHRWKVTV